MSVTYADFGTRQRGPAPLLVTHLPELKAPAVAWWHCPGFCDGTCFGGETMPRGHLVPREHFKTTLLRTVLDVGQGDEVPVEVGVIARETAEGYLDPTNVTFEMPGDITEMSADDAETVALAILAAVALARQALPTITRSPSEGGGRDLTSGRGDTPRCRPDRTRPPLESA